MGNLIQFPGSQQGDSGVNTRPNTSGIGVFRGKIDYEELEQDLDFANFLCFAFRQLPDKSKREFLRGMCMVQDLIDRAAELKDPQLSKLMVEMGFAVLIDENGHPLPHRP